MSEEFVDTTNRVTGIPDTPKIPEPPPKTTKRKPNILSRSQFLKKSKTRQYKIIPVEEWDADIRIKNLSANEIFQYEKDVKDGKDVDERKALGLMAILSIVDADGVAQFAPTDLDDLLNTSASVMTMVGQVAMAFNKIDADEIKKIVGNY